MGKYNQSERGLPHGERTQRLIPVRCPFCGQTMALLRPERPNAAGDWSLWYPAQLNEGGDTRYGLEVLAGPIAADTGRSWVGQDSEVLKCRKGHSTRGPVLFSVLIERACAALEAVGEARAQVTLPKRLFA